MSLLGLLKAAKLVIVRSLFCNFSMNTKPGRTAFALKIVGKAIKHFFSQWYSMSLRADMELA